MKLRSLFIALAAVLASALPVFADVAPIIDPVPPAGRGSATLMIAVIAIAVIIIAAVLVVKAVRRKKGK